MIKPMILGLACGLALVSSVHAFDYGYAGGPNWSTGCCQDEPLCSDHLWDDYCATKAAHQAKWAEWLQRHQHGSRCVTCSGGCSGPACSRWRPRGGASLGGFRGFRGSAHGGCSSCQSVMGPAAPAHGYGCLCPQCQPRIDASQHGAGCVCPQCQAAASAAPPAPGTIDPEMSFEEAPAAEQPFELESPAPLKEEGDAEPIEPKDGAAEDDPADAPPAAEPAIDPPAGA
jgi:hypothetical protein